MNFNTENSEFINDKTCSYERLHKSHSLTELLETEGFMQGNNTSKMIQLSSAHHISLH